MTRKDYVALAGALKAELVNQQGIKLERARIVAVEAVRCTMVRIADVLAADNEAFDRDRFLDAAGWRIE